MWELPKMTARSEAVLPSLFQVAGKKKGLQMSPYCRNLIFRKGKCTLFWCYSQHKDWSWSNKGPQEEGLGLDEVFHSLVVTVMQVVQPSQVLFLLCLLVTVSYQSLSVNVKCHGVAAPATIKNCVSYTRWTHVSKFCRFHVPSLVSPSCSSHHKFGSSWPFSRSYLHFSGPVYFLQRVRSKPHIRFFFPLGSFDFCNL